MGKNKTDNGASMFSRTESMFDVDPMQEIFELNLGDFMVEHLISDELAKKIGTNVHNKLENLKKQLKELISIYSIDKTLVLLGFSAKEEHVIYNSIAKTAKQMVGMENCYIFLTKDNCHKEDSDKVLHLVGSSVENLTVKEMNKMALNVDDDSIVAKAFKLREVIELKTRKEVKSYKIHSDDENICYMLAIPMYNNLEKVGVILVEKTDSEPMAHAYESLIKATAALFATSMVLQKLTDEIKELLSDKNVSVSHLQQLRAELTGVIGDLGEQQQLFVEAMAIAVDRRTKYKNPHSKETAELSKKICEFLNLNEKTKDLIYYAGLLQNIGKITLPSEIFNKKESLSKDDWDKLENHPNIGVSLLMNSNFMSEVVPYIHYHKERWDGKGKPEGLKGYSIPLGSRIIAVADAYCALRTDRAHRKAFSKEEAIRIIQEESGIKWDPMLVDVIEHVCH
ncbi:HD domain-containing protein [bacterium]|nr:HD domain-containing protein [bacterium]